MMVVDQNIILAVVVSLSGGGLITYIVTRLIYMNRINLLLQERNTSQQTHAEALQKMADLHEKTVAMHMEKAGFLEQSKAQLKLEFESLANKIFEDKQSKFSLDTRVNLENILSPLHTDLNSFRKKAEDIYVTEGKERASLKTEIERLYILNQQITDEAANLTNALKGNNKTQGSWGELRVEMLLIQSGLQKGRDFLREPSFKEERGVFRPDFIVKLPEGRHIVIDSKVSLVDYTRYHEAQTDEAKNAAIKAHLLSVRSHVSALSKKAYHQIRGVDSPDFVLMFMPIEPAFSLAFEHDEKLFNDAFDQHIIVVTPTTLLATLRTVANLWSMTRQSQNARQLSDLAGKVYDKCRGLVENMEKLGAQIDTLQSTYLTTWSSLKSGRGNLISQTQKFVELGVRVKKEHSSRVLDDVEMTPDEEDSLS